MKIKLKNIRLFFILVFIFFDSVGLSFGLQWTMLLTPILFFNTIFQYKKAYLLAISIYLFFFVCHYSAHIASFSDYIKSSFLHFTVVIICIAFHSILRKNRFVIFDAFDKAVVINFILTLTGIALFLVGNMFMWQTAIGNGAFAHLPRLRLLTYEPSVYSTFLLPIFFFYFARLTEKVKRNNLISLALITLSLALSLSLGVISTIVFVLFFINILALKRKSMMIIMGCFILFCLGLVFLFFINPNNSLFARIADVVNMQDVSGNARLFDPWTLSYQILKKNGNTFFTGIGWGQIKIVGHDIIQNFYGYFDNDDSQDVSYGLPNLVCAMLTTTGILGLCIYFSILIYFYRKTKVSKSGYRKYLFWFAFIYQFTSGYTSFTLLYVIFILAYYPPIDTYFVQFKNVITKKKKSRLRGIPQPAVEKIILSR